jgi:hypothetical protein
VSAQTESIDDGEGASNWRSRLAVPAAAVVAIACCLGAPFVLGAAATLTAGAWVGVGVGLVALAAICALAFTRIVSDKRC